MTANPDPLYTTADELRTVADLSLRFSEDIDRYPVRNYTAPEQRRPEL